MKLIDILVFVFLPVNSIIIIREFISISPGIIIWLETIFINYLLILTSFCSTRNMIELLFLKSKQVILIELVLYLAHTWSLQHLLILLQTCLLLQLLEILLMISLIINLLSWLIALISVTIRVDISVKWIMMSSFKTTLHLLFIIFQIYVLLLTLIMIR